MLIGIRMAYTSSSCDWTVPGKAVAHAAIGLLCAAALAPQVASAHAPPRVIDVVFRDDAGPVFVTNRGLILADSDAGPFRLLCTEATKTNTGEYPDVLALPGGQLILATSRGLIRSKDGGCSFDGVEPLADVLVPAAAPDPEDASHFYVAAFDATRGGLFETSDGGESFTTLQPASESDFIATILIAPSRPRRLYLDGQLIGNGTITTYVASSDDGGISFERFELALLATEDAFELLAVSPGDPDLLVGRASDGDANALQDRLLVSRDRGQTWTSPLTVHAMSDARFSEDGSTLWVSGIDGAFRSDDDLGSFQALPDALRISLALEHAGEPWVCGFYDGMHDGVAAIDSAGTLRPVMRFVDVMEPAACDATSPSTLACTNLWHDWQRELFGILPDAGVPVPAPEAGSASQAGQGGSAGEADAGSNRSRSDGGCSVARGAGGSVSGAGSAFTALAAFAVSVARRRRRRRRRRRLLSTRGLCQARS